MKNIIIIGSGKAGTLLAGDIAAHHKDITLIGFVDDEVQKKNLGQIRDLGAILLRYKVDELLIAIPSASGSVVRSILLQCKDMLPLSIRILPRTFEIVMKTVVCLSDTRHLIPEDIVGEHIEKHNQLLVYKEMRHKSILITGAGGSIGSELAKQVVLAHPKRVVCVDFSEYNLFHLKLHLDAYQKEIGDVEIHLILGDINNDVLMKELFSRYGFHTVFHAAAYKHVPALEENAYEAAHNNITGTYTIARLAHDYKATKCILISTDKAVLPKSIMGKTKKIAELLMDHFGFTSVRFGNVFNSSGSAVEVFLKQIKENSPLTITNAEMTRFFMTIHEAVHLVLQTWLISKKKETYMLEMSDPVSILEIASCLSIMHGRKLDKTSLTLIGKRKGEKLHEILLDPTREHKKASSHPRIYSVEHSSPPTPITHKRLEELLSLIASMEVKNHSLLGEKKLKQALTHIIEEAA